jgi:hypothetical protein
MATESACTSEKITTPITVGEYWCFFVIKTHDTRGYTLEHEGIKICSCPRDSKVLVEDLMKPRQTGEMPFSHETRLSCAIPFFASGLMVIAVLLRNTGIIPATGAFAGCCVAGSVLFWYTADIRLKGYIVCIFILLYAFIILSGLREFSPTLIVLLLSAPCTIILVHRLNAKRDSSENQKEDLKQWTDFYQSTSTV